MATCTGCGGRGGWYEPDEGTWVTCRECGGTGQIPGAVATKVRRPRAKPFEAVMVRLADGAERVLSTHTTDRAALNAMGCWAFFGPPGFAYRVRDSRTGEWGSELSR